MTRRAISAVLWLAAAVVAAPGQTGATGADATPAAVQPTQPLDQQIAAILAAPAVARDHWGIQVTTLDGKPLYSLNEAQLFQPASNAKLYTTAAAFALLGPDKTFETQVTGILDPATGHVTGDLVFNGVGDANLDSRDIPYLPPASRPKNAPHRPNHLGDVQDLVNQLVAKGVKQVDGNIVGDDSFYPYDPFPPNWSIDDAVWGYSAPVSALTIADNQLRMTVTPAAQSNQPASVSLEQGVPYYTIENKVRTVSTKAEATGVDVVRTPGSPTLLVAGSIALGAEVDVEQIAIDDPAEYAAMALKAALLEKGIAVKGSAETRHGYRFTDANLTHDIQTPNTEEVDTITGLKTVLNDCYVEGSVPNPKVSVLARHRSAPLSDDITYTNKVSQNLHAELLLRHIGHIDKLCGNGSNLTGARMRRELLTIKAGIDPNDFILYDGSGLSSHDLVTPRATAKLLQYATTQPWFATWKASLPIGGEDGTLEKRFPKPPLKDHLFAKTGTLGEARALSGYLDAASGRTVIFSIMVGNHLPGTSDDRDAMDKIVALIQAAE